MLLINTLSSIALMATFASLHDSDSASSVYGSEEEAVVAAVNQYNPTSIAEDREFIGAIYHSDEGYYFSVIPGRRGSDRITMRVSREDLENITAFWHTHGNFDSKNRYFSDTDTELADRLMKPLYMADYTGYLKVFEPNGKTLNSMSASRLGLPRATGYAIGKLVRDPYGRPFRINTRASDQIG